MSKAVNILCLILATCLGLLDGTDNRMPPLEQAPPKEANRPNPYAGREEARQAGEKLFRRECAECHGRDAQGSEHVPALASSPRLRQAPPGAIFWLLRNGSLGRGMPSFSHLPEQRRWQIVTYLKTL